MFQQKNLKNFICKFNEDGVSAKGIAEMSAPVSKWIINSISDKNHTSQVSNWTVHCFVNRYTFFFNTYIHIQCLHSGTNVTPK